MEDRFKERLREQLERIYRNHKSSLGLLSMYLFRSTAEGCGEIYLQCGGSHSSAVKLPATLPVEEFKLNEVAYLTDQVLRTSMDDAGFSYIVTFPKSKNTYFLLAFETDAKELTEDKEQILNLIADDLTHIFQIRYLSTELNQFSGRMEQVVAEMGALHEISRAFESSRNLEQLLNDILEKCQNLMRGEAASLMLLDEETNELEFKVVLGPKSEEVKNLRLPVGKGIGGWVAQHGQPLLIPDVNQDPRFNPSFDKKSGYVTKSILAVPLIYNAKVTGVVNILNRLDGEPFCESDKTFLTTFASQAALAIENARLLQSTIEKESIERELKVAGEIQQLLIPVSLPSINGLDISATYIPCKEVSGDFYDVIPLDDNRFVFVVADVAGKGVPAALMVSTMQAALIAYLEQSHDMLYIVNKLNGQLIRTTAEDRFITCFIGLFNARTGTLDYVNAGHNPPILMAEDGSVRYLETGGVFIGSIPWQYESETIRLKNNDLVCLFTDGLFEVTNEKLEQFGLERVLHLLRANRLRKPDDIVRSMTEAVKHHIGTKKMDDDLTVLLLKKMVV